jgi:hypothetical protein
MVLIESILFRPSSSQFVKPPAGDTGDGVQDDAERRPAAFLRKKVRINAVLYQIRANAQNVKHDEP